MLPDAPLDSWHLFTADFGTLAKPLTCLVTLLDMAIYFAFVLQVGKARAKFGIQAPATDGPEKFQSILRVQQNTAEQLVFHLPLLWLACFAMDDAFAALAGLLWAIGRIIYARGYYRKPKRRHKGFVIGLTADAILFTGAAASILASL